MTLQCGAHACRHQWRLAAFELRADCIEADAGKRCEEDESAEHGKHEPLTALRPGQHDDGADHDGNGQSVGQAGLWCVQEIRDARANPCERRPGG